MMTFILNRHPWLLLVLCFGILLTAWCSLITIAVKFRPEKISLEAVHNNEQANTPPQVPANGSSHHNY